MASPADRHHTWTSAMIEACLSRHGRNGLLGGVLIGDKCQSAVGSSSLSRPWLPALRRGCSWGTLPLSSSASPHTMGAPGCRRAGISARSLAAWAHGPPSISGRERCGGEASRTGTGASSFQRSSWADNGGLNRHDRAGGPRQAQTRRCIDDAVALRGSGPADVLPHRLVADGESLFRRAAGQGDVRRGGVLVHLAGVHLRRRRRRANRSLVLVRLALVHPARFWRRHLEDGRAEFASFPVVAGRSRDAA